MTSPERVAVLGTGLIGTSIAMAALRAGGAVSGFDADASVLEAAARGGGFARASSIEDAAESAGIVFVCTPIPTIPALVARALAVSPDALVSDVGSVKSHLVAEVRRLAPPASVGRFVGGHPMGGSERSGPDGAS